MQDSQHSIKSSINNQVAKILMSIGAQEQMLETQREDLCSNNNIDPQTTFCQMDKSEKGYIDANDINIFLTLSKGSLTEKDGNTLVNLWSLRKDERISQKDFLDKVLPFENNVLRLKATTNQNKKNCQNKNIESHLIRLIYREIEGHQRLESSRKQLNEDIDFNINNIFSSLGLQNDEYINEEQVQTFLQNSGFTPSKKDVKQIFRRIDLDRDNKITCLDIAILLTPVNKWLANPNQFPSYESYSNFWKSINPKKKAIEDKIQAEEESLIQYSYDDNLKQKKFNGSSPIKHAQLLEDELNQNNQPEILNQSKIHELINRSPKIDQTSDNINRQKRLEELENRLNNSKNFQNDQQLSAVKRLSEELNNMSKLSSPKKNYISNNIELESELSPLKKSPQQNNNTLNYTPINIINNSIQNKSITNSPAPIKKLHFDDLLTPMKSSPIKELQYSPIKPYTDIKTPSIKQQHLNNDINMYPMHQKFSRDDLLELINALKRQIELGHILEAVKTNLNNRTNFNQQDAQYHFDPTSKGQITSFDLKDSLNKLNIACTRDHVFLVMRKQNKSNNGKLSQVEFVNMLSPKQEQFSIMDKIIGRITDDETICNFKELLKLIINTEIEMEIMRQHLQNKSSFSLHEAFQVLDISNRGYLTINEFREVLNAHGCNMVENDLLVIMNNYDKNKIGRVTQSEFVQELSPKSPMKII